jgi:hypothetical protein
MMRFRRKPAVVEAYQWGHNGQLHGPDPWRDLQEAFGLKDIPHRMLNGVVSVYAPGMQNSVTAGVGDWILRHEDGSMESIPNLRMLAEYDPIEEDAHERDCAEPDDHPPASELSADPAPGERAEAERMSGVVVCGYPLIGEEDAAPPEPLKKTRKKQNRPKA